MSETKPQAERLVSAQVGVLGALLIDSDCVADVLARTSERMFVSEQYRTVYRAIRQLFQAAKPVDPVTVADRLRETAGADYRELLLQMMDLTPTSANVLSYVDILRRESIVWATAPDRPLRWPIRRISQPVRTSCPKPMRP